MIKEGANVVMKWTQFSLKSKTIFEHNTPNFYTPLTSQVEALATPLESINSILVAPPWAKIPHHQCQRPTIVH